MRIDRTGWPVLALFAGLTAVAGCAAGTPSPEGNAVAGTRPLGPFYGVPQDMVRPDGTMLNGLLPINPDDQS